MAAGARGDLLAVLASWVAGRVLVALVGLAARAASTPAAARAGAAVHGVTAARLVWPWDGAFYVAIARYGYETAPPPAGAFGAAGQQRAAFFPGYPLLLAAVHRGSGLSRPVSGLVVSVLGGAVGVVLCWLVLRAAPGVSAAAARRAGVLLGVVPGGVVLSVVYAEGLLLALVAGALLCALRGRWVVAGLLAAGAGLTRPSAVALAAALLVLGWPALRPGRPAAGPARWRVAVGVLGAPAGTLGYLVWIGLREHRLTAWFAVERQGWNQHLNFGLGFGRPLLHPALLRTGLWALFGMGFVTLGWVAYQVWRRGARLPAFLGALVAVVVAQCLLDSSVGPRPRFLLVAFPLAVLATHRLSRRGFVALLAVHAAALAGATLLLVVPGVVAP